MSRKLNAIALASITLLLLTGCLSLASFFPVVDSPFNQDSSMLVLEVGTKEGTSTSALLNTNASGWAPWVEDSSGKLIPFRPFDTEARLDSFYFSENLAPGSYTLKGFMHVYVDYAKLKQNEIPTYGPFADYPYHVVQQFALSNPVTIELKKAQMATFGRYFITSSWVGGAAGTTDDRWKVVPSSVAITGDPADKKALRVAKNWATPAWSAWNTKNSEKAADK